jgi:hypothetical protein
MISIGLMMASQNTSEAFNFSCSISLFDLMFVAPVNFRRRWALRLRILSAELIVGLTTLIFVWKRIGSKPGVGTRG